MLAIASLNKRPEFAEHSRETFESAIDTAEQIAKELFANHNRAADEEEPTFDGEKVSMRPEVKVALDAVAEAGFIAGRESFEDGGMQLPESVMSACLSLFTAANPSTTGYPFLTMAAARVIKSFASDDLKQQFLPKMLSGKFTGTMALTEPHAGSSLADIRSKATPTEDGTYRIQGNKVFISGGDHELSDNIVHLVLAKIEGAADGVPARAGVKGISLFLVPKFLLDENGEPSKRNDVALAGLFHKLGYRGTTSTALNFGEKNECVGYLIGEPHRGLSYMFQMMNEARLGVGMGGAAIGYRGYQLALSYAKDRPQGRLPSDSHPETDPVNIIQHADVKRMLLAQKAYAEGALALCFYGAGLIDDANTAECSKKEEAQLILDLLTPILKAWPSEFGPKANDLAIQVHGGAGYTREYDAELCWRDNRLNPIHEGTNGIQSLDLLGRKVWQQQGMGLKLLHKEIEQTLQNSHDNFKPWASQLKQALNRIAMVTAVIGQAIQKDPDTALANSHAYLSMMGHTVVAWLWLKQANIAQEKVSHVRTQEERAFYAGKIQAAQYFFVWELPLIERDFAVLSSMDTTTIGMQEEWF